MSILWDEAKNIACLYDPITGVVFGQTFEGNRNQRLYTNGCYRYAEEFLEWLISKGLDARSVQPNTLRSLRAEFADSKVSPLTRPLPRVYNETKTIYCSGKPAQARVSDGWWACEKCGTKLWKIAKVALAPGRSGPSDGSS